MKKPEALLLLAIALHVALLAVDAYGADRWAVAPKVKYIHEGSPIESYQVEEAIRQVVWSWRGRIPKLEISYAGMTLGPAENAVITYRWHGLAEHIQLTGSFLSKGAEQTWISLDTGLTVRSVIFLNSAYFEKGIDDCAMMAFSHELGHALGVRGHSSDPNDLMYYAPSHCRPTPTDSDVLLAGHTPTTCYTEMTKDYDLFIPEISGKEAYLEYEGGHTWRLSYLADTPTRGCLDNRFNVVTGELRLVVIGRSEAYSARMGLIEGDRFQLIDAEAL